MTRAIWRNLIGSLLGTALFVAVGAGTAWAQRPVTVWTWGYNDEGELGIGNSFQSNSAVQAIGLVGATAVAGGGKHSLALLQDGTVWAWGSNSAGQLGNGANADSNVPTPVTGLSGVVAIAAGGEHSMALTQSGAVWAWGDNAYGELGNGDPNYASSNVPVQVTGLSNIVAIAAGKHHNLALTQAGAVWAWGWNQNGQLGIRSNTDRNVPTLVSGVSYVTAIACGSAHSLAVLSDQTVSAWGDNQYGQLGNASMFDVNAPTMVNGLGGVKSVAGGLFHSLALKLDGTVWAWGWNSYGQLGDASNADADAPVQANGLTHATAIAAGSYSSVALNYDGTVAAWGDNEDGEIGNGTSASSTVPLLVTALSGVKAIASGDSFALAVKVPSSSYAFLTVTPVVSTVPYGTPVTLDVVANLADGTSKDVTSDPGTTYAVANGSGNLSGSTYSSNQAETAVVSVTYSSGGVTASARAQIAETNAIPSLGAVGPNSLAADSPAATIALSGTGFVPGALVRWNGSPISTNYTSATHLTAMVPTSYLTTVGSATVDVVNPGPGNPASNALAVSITPAAVATVTVTPYNVSVLEGTPVTLTVVATYRDGTTKDVTADPATVYAVAHGVGTLSGSTYTSSRSEAAVITVSYAFGGVTASSACYITENSPIIPVSYITVSPYNTTVGYGTPVALRVVATYKSGPSKDVTSDPATTYRLVHGTGTLSGSTYTSNRTEAAVLTASYTFGGVTASNACYITSTTPGHGRILSASLTPYTQTVAYPTPVTLVYTVTYQDGTTVNVSTGANTVYTVQHGSGTVTGSTYVSHRAEAAVIVATYTEPTTGQVVSRASYINEYVRLPRHLLVTPLQSTVVHGTPVAFTATVVYTDGTQADVTTSPNTVYSIQHGVGSFLGNAYTSPRSEAATITVTYTETTISVMGVAYVVSN